jgi:phosphoribosylamine---glycine ligase
MKILILGGGGREHAIAVRLSQSHSVSEIHAAPGNDGMRRVAICHDWSWKDSDKLIEFCVRTEIDVVVIGPEDPLVHGIADLLRDRGILTVGPGADSARLEGSKVFAKEFMRDAKIPTARSVVVNSLAHCLEASAQFSPPYVLKADGLCAGKGVFICKTQNELKDAAFDIFEKRIFGTAGEVALLEEFNTGWELSVLITTNCEQYQILPLAQDHKRLFDQDQGPNTGGMGTWAPLMIENDLLHRIETEIIQPTLAELNKRSMNYRGFIFFGVMVTSEGPKLLEYNCRLGDPETQVVLPLINGDFGEILKNLAQGKILPIQTKKMFATCVVMAAPGYPMQPQGDVNIRGDLFAQKEHRYFIFAGAKLKSKADASSWVTSGGRVLCAMGLGPTKSDSIKSAYRQTEFVNWEGVQFRKDIGAGKI